MKAILIWLLLSAVCLAQAPTRRWTGGSNFEAIALQTVDGKMLIRVIPDATIREERTVLVLIPKDTPLVPDGNQVRVRVDAGTLRTVQFTDVTGAVRTVQSMVALYVRSVTR